MVDHLILLFQKHNIHPYSLDKDYLLQALLLCLPSNRVSFADALVWAAAQSADSRLVYSFDARFPRDGIEVRTA